MARLSSTCGRSRRLSGAISWRFQLSKLGRASIVSLRGRNLSSMHRCLTRLRQRRSAAGYAALRSAMALVFAPLLKEANERIEASVQRFVSDARMVRLRSAVHNPDSVWAANLASANRRLTPFGWRRACTQSDDHRRFARLPRAQAPKKALHPATRARAFSYALVMVVTCADEACSWSGEIAGEFGAGRRAQDRQMGVELVVAANHDGGAWIAEHRLVGIADPEVQEVDG
jgi:hypothetical protein